MDPKSHYALLVAINRYPGLSDLAGPENDAAALANWLEQTGGLEHGHVKVIRSSDFDPVQDPYDANPTDSHIKKALNAWLKDAQGQWRDRVGERLYLFFAGHGFTAGSMTDPALFTAQAQLDDRTHIAAYRYAAKIANAGFFDEIVLVMDCCQDVLKAAAVAEPSWSPPDRAASGRVKLMVALGAPRGHKAFEDKPEAAATGQPAPPVHGYFSKVFLEALRTAKADGNGDVTARAVEDRFDEIWAATYLQKTGYSPPFDAPKGLVLYRKPAAAAPSPADGLLGGTAVRAKREVRIDMPDLGAELRVFDSRRRSVARSDRGLKLELPAGRYRARVRVGGSVQERDFKVEPPAMVLHKLEEYAREPAPPQGEVKLEMPTLDFVSPVPAGWSRSHHEYQMGPCGSLLDRAGQAAASAPGDATLFVFARDSAHPRGAAWAMAPELRRALRLRRLAADDGATEAAPLQLDADEADGWCSFTQHLQAGTWRLGVRRRLRGRVVWDEIVLHVARGWRTEVYLDAIDDSEDGRRYDLDDAAVFVAPRGAGSLYGSDPVRRTELLREALLRGTGAGDADSPMPGFDPEALGPAGVLLAAALETLELLPNTAQVRQWLHWLRDRWSPASADVQLLERWCGAEARRAGEALPPAITLADDAVPMLARSFALLARPELGVALSGVAQHEVAMWRTAGGAWVAMQRPEPLPGAAGAAPPGPMPAAADGEPDLAQIAAALGRPHPLASPLHQMLRCALIDARDEADLAALSRAVAAVAREAAVGEAVVRAAIADLWALSDAGHRG